MEKTSGNTGQGFLTKLAEPSPATKADSGGNTSSVTPGADRPPPRYPTPLLPQIKIRFLPPVVFDRNAPKPLNMAPSCPNLARQVAATDPSKWGMSGNQTEYPRN